MSRPAPLSLGELIEHWTLRADEIDLVAVKHGDSKLAFALLLRFSGPLWALPRNRGELHPDDVEFMARAVKADPAELAGYDWSGRTIKRHRHEIRAHFGFRLCGEEDRARVVEFLAAGAAQRERRYELIKGLDLVGGRSCAPANASGNPGLIAALERITTADNVRKIAGENWLRVLGTATAP